MVATMALARHWELMILLWSYWLQSVAVGIFHVFRILRLDRFSAEGFRMSGVSTDDIRRRPGRVKVAVALFFTVHYGGFHLFYGFFLALLPFLACENADRFIGLIGSWRTVLLNGALFSLHYSLQFVLSKPDPSAKPNIGTVLFEPYLRILPIHLVIILFFFMSVKYRSGPEELTRTGLAVFLGLKTLADVLAYGLARRRDRR